MQAQERRAQMVRIGVRVAADKGIGRLAHAEVAREAKVSTATAFLYFPTREALVKTVIAEVDQFYRAMARRSHESPRAPMQRIHDHVFTFSDSIETDREYAIVWLEWSTLFRNEFGLWDAFVDFQEFVIAQISKSVRQCQNEGVVDPKVSAGDSARLIVAGAYAVTQLKLMKRRRHVVDRFAEQMLAQALT